MSAVASAETPYVRLTRLLELTEADYRRHAALAAVRRDAGRVAARWWDVLSRERRGRLLPYVLGAVIGALALYAWLPNEPVVYENVVVPAARIVEREVPGPTEVRWRDRVVYRYLQPDVKAVAPEGARLELSLFCTLPEPEAPATHELVRSVSHSPSLWPLRRDALTVTSMTNAGDLVARDYRVRPGFGVAAGEGGVAVRYPRLGLARELGEGLAWYGLLRAVEAVVR